MIACPRCGWAACVAPEHENSVWQTHLAGTACVDVIPLRTKNPSPYRARLCIQGHERDILGISWTCLSRGAGSWTAPGYATGSSRSITPWRR